VRREVIGVIRRGVVLAMTVLLLGACESVGEPPTGAGAASSPTTSAAPASGSAASPSPSNDVEGLEPTASIPLSGGTATGMVQADGALWVVHFEDGVLSRVDPEAETEAGTNSVGPNGTSLTALDGKLWVARGSMGAGQSFLTVVDAASGEVEQEIPLSNVCCQAALAGGSVWAVDPGGTLFGLAPDSGEVLHSTPVELDNLTGHVDLAGDDRALWISSDTTPLTHVDPSTGDLVDELDVGGGIPMLLDGDRLWGASPHHVWAIDPTTGDQQLTFDLADTIETFSIALTDDAIWVGARRPGHVGVLRRYDLTTHELTGEAAIALPARVVLAFDGIWVLDAESNEVLRFDP
jgi:streptogramin lyase